ncbi:hypothetical protein [Nonomuraea sp. NPDC023979]|uniref:hypothetical protein n=1 Tax=Nonomuraea sp. NPDC023979 TaxID=3154796 RepID=UPI0033CB0B67
MSVHGQAEGIEHGTIRGYRQHKYRQVEACEPCKGAKREDQARRRGKPPVIPGARFRSDAQAAWYGGTMSPDEMADAHQRQRARRQAPGEPMPRMYTRPYSPHPIGWEDPAWGVRVTGPELTVGDVIVHLGRHYPIDRFEPYEGSLDAVLGEHARVACSGDWGLPVSATHTARILPREAA